MPRRLALIHILKDKADIPPAENGQLSIVHGKNVLAVNQNPVSYTHLDVYKRQVLKRVLITVLTLVILTLGALAVLSLIHI